MAETLSDGKPVAKKTGHGGSGDAARFERMAKRITIDPETGCWLWTGYLTYKGYGKSHNRPAHRVMFELCGGTVPPGHHLHHECEVRRCVYPSHMRVVTPGEHMQIHGISEKGVAVHSKKRRERTHCIHGHEFTPENTSVFNGSRRCLTCNRERQRARRARLRCQ